MCVPAPACNPMLNTLTLNVQSGELVFPDSVLRDCKSYAPDETGTVWLAAVAGHRANCDTPYGYLEKVLAQCRRLYDEESEDEQSQPDVAALALWRVDQGDQVFLVSEDLQSPPTRMSLHAAAPLLGLQAVTLGQYLTTQGLRKYLR